MHMGATPAGARTTRSGRVYIFTCVYMYARERTGEGGVVLYVLSSVFFVCLCL